MSHEPQTESQIKDIVDVMTQATQNVEEVRLEDGSIQKTLVVDPKHIFYKTLNVTSTKLGGSVLSLEKFLNHAKLCSNFMAFDRAKGIAEQIVSMYTPYTYSYDAKSSESIRLNGSSQSTVFDKLARNKIERSYNVKGEHRRSMIDAILGKDKDDDMEND